MITEYIRYRIAEPERQGFEQAYARACAVLARAAQCQDYELTRCTEDPGSYVLRIRWTSAEDHLRGFRAGDLFPAFFAEIRPYVEAVEEMRHYEATGVEGRGGAVPTLYEWAGGAEALERLFTRFYARVADDDLLAPVFAGMDPRHPQYVAAWLGEVFGGPARYSAERGAGTGVWPPATWGAASPRSTGGAGSRCSWTPPTRPGCPATRSSSPPRVLPGVGYADGRPVRGPQPAARRRGPRAALGLGRPPALPRLKSPGAGPRTGGYKEGTDREG